MLAILWKPSDVNSLSWTLWTKGAHCKREGSILNSKLVVSWEHIAGLETKQRKEIECLMGCKLSLMYLLKQRAVKEREAERPCFVLRWCSGALRSVIRFSCDWQCPGEAVLERNRELPQDWEERGEEWKMGCLTTRSSPEAILMHLRSVCVHTQLFYTGSSLRSTAFILGKTLCLGSDVNCCSKSRALLCWYKLHIYLWGDLGFRFSLGKWCQRYSSKSNYGC